jgi:hypothetical protein
LKYQVPLWNHKVFSPISTVICTSLFFVYVFNLNALSVFVLLLVLEFHLFLHLFSLLQHFR